MAWALCWVDRGSCERLGVSLSTGSGALRRLSDSLIAYGQVFAYGTGGAPDGQALLDAYSLCFTLTSVHMVPFLVVLGFALLMVLPIVRLSMSFLLSVLSFWVAATSAMTFAVQMAATPLSGAVSGYASAAGGLLGLTSRATRRTARRIGQSLAQVFLLFIGPLHIH